MPPRRTAPKRGLLLRWLDRLPIRWRIATITATLVGGILLLFAVAIGGFVADRVQNDFRTQTAARFDALQQRLRIRLDPRTDEVVLDPKLVDIGTEPGTVIAAWVRNAPRWTFLESTDPRVDLGRPGDGREDLGGYQVESRRIELPWRDATGAPITRATGQLQTELGPSVLTFENSRLRYTSTLEVRIGRSYAAVERTTHRIWTALALGVLAGTLLALVGGLALGNRAMRPVRRMTGTARHIARTRNLGAKMPISKVHDEIAELGGTLQDMLDELAAAQARVDETLQRQREFVADASHELRTPLTAVQANLELLALSTDGDDREAAESALRSARRMRRLVADLLLLARMDAARETAREPVDLDRAILEAVDELEPQMHDHDVDLDLEPVTIDGARDELVRMVVNLVGNALRHTPAGTEIRVRLRSAGGRTELVVEDDGPGIPEDLRARIFERFVRRGGEAAGSTGIGLAIVRAAAQRHGGVAGVAAEAVHLDEHLVERQLAVRAPGAPGAHRLEPGR
ncbi:sensor histidine kinase, partial [Patulibacter sp. S7RM1-6]